MLDAGGLVSKRPGELSLTEEGRLRTEAFKRDAGRRAKQLGVSAAWMLDHQAKLVRAAELAGRSQQTAFADVAATVRQIAVSPEWESLNSMINHDELRRHAASTIKAQELAAQFTATDLQDRFPELARIAASDMVALTRAAAPDFSAFARTVAADTPSLIRVMPDIQALTSGTRALLVSDGLPASIRRMTTDVAASLASVHRPLDFSDVTGLCQSIATAAASVAEAGSQTVLAFKAIESVQGFRIDLASTIAATIPALNLSDYVSSLDWGWIEDFRQRERVEAAFAAADLVPSPSMDQALIERVVEAHESGATPDQLAELVLAEYDRDDCARAAALVERLCKSDDFKGREFVLRQTLLAHRAGYDAITAYALVSMIEGVTIPFLAEMTDAGWVNHNGIARELQEWPLWVVSVVRSEAYACLLRYVEDRLYHRAHWKTEDPATRGDFAVLNRHRLLHGIALQGTRIGALQCFLVLDIIDALLGAVRSAHSEGTTS